MAASRAVAARQGRRPWPHGFGQSPVREWCSWVLRSGAHWCDLPERYGKWKSLHQRFARWSKAGVWERVFEALIDDADNEYLMLDTTLVRAHQQAATGKGGTKTRLWGVPEED